MRLSLQLSDFIVKSDDDYCQDDIVARYGESIISVLMDAKSLGVHQVTLRLIGKPDASINPRAAAWVDKHGMQWAGKHILKVMEAYGHPLATYHWGGKIFDFEGLSVCVADCLTEDPGKFEPRSWIFDGKHLRYSWQYKGALVF